MHIAHPIPQKEAMHRMLPDDEGRLQPILLDHEHVVPHPRARRHEPKEAGGRDAHLDVLEGGDGFRELGLVVLQQAEDADHEVFVFLLQRRPWALAGFLGAPVGDVERTQGGGVRRDGQFPQPFGRLVGVVGDAGGVGHGADLLDRVEEEAADGDHVWVGG